MKFVIFSRLGLRGRRWYWRLVARNGEIVAQSEAYTRAESAVKTIQSIQNALCRGPAPIEWEGRRNGR